MNLRKIYTATLLVCLIGISVAYIGCRAKSQISEKDIQEEVVPVEVVKIDVGPIKSSIKSTANLIAEKTVTVIARTSNRVKKLFVEEGDFVTEGALLLELEDQEQRLRLESAQIQLEKLMADLERSEQLYKQNLISKQVYEELLFQYKSARISVQQAQLELEYTKVKAPISGVVARRYVNVGAFINTGQNLFDIYDPNSLIAPVYIPDRYLPLLQVGLKAIVRATALKGTEFEGYVKRISPVVESQTGTIKVVIGFEHPGQLRPGMYTEIEIITKEIQDALLIPKRALIYDEELVYVYRVKPDMKVERVIVKFKVEDKNFIVPERDFNVGDLIVITGQTGLRDGMKVKLVQEEIAAQN